MSYAFDSRQTGDALRGLSAEAEGLDSAHIEPVRTGSRTATAPRPVVAEPPRDRPRPRPARPAQHSDRRLIGLDGLRAIAVLSVVIFHLGFALAPGGFLGVDVFFVISGFLITKLLATEILDTGRLALGRFYLRRARRLFPAVFVVLVAVIVASTTVWHDQLATLKGGVISSLAYVTNWWLIFDHQSYFVSSGRPSMLQHLWSLAIEEQYYLVWSVVVMLLAGLLLAGRPGSRRSANLTKRLEILVMVAIALAVASTLVMAYIAERDQLPFVGGVSRVYFGSDTHTMGLFLGSAGGAWLALRHHRHHRSSASTGGPRWVYPTDAVGLVALAVVCYQFFDLDEFSPLLYRGGFLAFDAAVLVAILCATRPGSILGQSLDTRPLRWVGQRSYAIYLWHWPVCVVTRPGIDVDGPIWLIDLSRLVLILGLAALSYRFIEVPLRTGQFAAWWRRQRGRPGLRRGELAAGLVVVASVGTLALAAAPVIARPAPRVPPVAQHPSVEAPISPAPSGHGHAPRSVRHAQPAKTSKPALSGYGDSVLLGSGPELEARTSAFRLNADEGRPAHAVLDDITKDVHRAVVEPDVLIHVGNNGIISPDQLATTLEALSGAKRVLLLTVRAPRDWQDPNNHTIRAVGSRFANVKVVDWYDLSASHRSWFYSDAIHLTPAGAAGYARLVLRELNR